MDARSRNNRQNRSQQGFSLIEIVFAVLIFAGSLVVLLGLQSSSLQLTARDKLTQRAMLYARRILAPLETSSDPIEIQDVEGTVRDLLARVTPGDIDLAQDESIDPNFRAHLKVESWGIPNINDEAMKRLSLTIRWSQSSDDMFQIVYFLPNDGDGIEDEEGEL